MDKIAVSKLVTCLKELDDANFAEVLGELFEVKRPFAEENQVVSQFFLGVAVYSSEEQPPWDVRAVSYADRTVYGDRTGESFPHFGACLNCRTHLLGSVKKVVCPICKEKNQLT